VLEPRGKPDARERWLHQLGTLGGGNHFIEVCLDESDRVWAMLHSGSRGIGNRIGQHFIAKAREEMLRLDVRLPDRDLAYLTERTRDFDDYVEAVGWAQDYALANRRAMMRAVLDAMRAELGPFETDAGRDRLPPQLRRARAPPRARRAGHAQGRDPRGRRRARHHPGQHGRAELHRARQGQPGLVRVLRARRRAGA
jgi:hypothetical protein